MYIYIYIHTHTYIYIYICIYIYPPDAWRSRQVTGEAVQPPGAAHAAPAGGKRAAVSAYIALTSPNTRLSKQVTGEVVQPPGAAYKESAGKRGAVSYVPFDFHSVCGKLAFRNLPRLVKVLQTPMARGRST